MPCCLLQTGSLIFCLCRTKAQPKAPLKKKNIKARNQQNSSNADTAALHTHTGAHTHNSKAEEPHILSDDRAGKGVPLEASQTPFPAKKATAGQGHSLRSIKQPQAYNEVFLRHRETHRVAVSQPAREALQMARSSPKDLCPHSVFKHSDWLLA